MVTVTRTGGTGASGAGGTSTQSVTSALGLATLVTRVAWASLLHRRRHPLVSASIRGALRHMLPRLFAGGLERSIFVTTDQIDSFLEHGWSYTERRLQLLQDTAAFPFDAGGARQLWDLRQRMEAVRGGDFEDVEAGIYADPLYAVFQHVGQAFRNEVSGRLPFVTEMLASLSSVPARIGDIGCGSGLLLGDVLESCPGAAGVGVDVSRVMLRHAARVIDARGLRGRTAFVAADMRRLPFPDGAFDFLIANEVLEHVPEPLDGIRELRRVLRPGGYLASSIPVGDDVPTHLCLFGSVDEVLDLHRTGGFEITGRRVTEVAPGVPDVMVAARSAP